jgi:hypothetical protein
VTKRKRWALVWAGWFGYFAVAESLALASDEPSAPLCGVLRPVLGARKGNVHTTLGMAAYGSFAAWFAVHLFGRKRGV